MESVNIEQVNGARCFSNDTHAKLVAGELVVFRAALNAIRSRSAAEDDGNIFDAAGRLIDLMDDRTEVDNRARRKLAIEKMRLKLLVPRWPMRKHT